MEQPGAHSAGDPLPQSREKTRALLGRWSSLGTCLGASTGRGPDEPQLELLSGLGRMHKDRPLWEWVSLRIVCVLFINLFFTTWVFSEAGPHGLFEGSPEPVHLNLLLVCFSLPRVFWAQFIRSEHQRT